MIYQDHQALREYANDLSNDAMRVAKERITVPSGVSCEKCNKETELKMNGNDFSEVCSCGFKEELI